MVKKIRKVSKKGPKATYAVPLVMPMTALFGPRCEGRPFWATMEDPHGIHAVLSRHLAVRLLLADRILPIREYLDWGLRSSPGRVAALFGDGEILPMGHWDEREGADPSDLPKLGVLVLVASVKGAALREFSDRLGQELSEVDRAVFENSADRNLQIIPGYDRLLYVPPLHARSLNAGIDHLNQQVEDAFGKAGVEAPGPFDACPSELLGSVPAEEPLPH